MSEIEVSNNACWFTKKVVSKDPINEKRLFLPDFGHNIPYLSLFSRNDKFENSLFWPDFVKNELSLIWSHDCNKIYPEPLVELRW